MSTNKMGMGLRALWSSIWSAKYIMLWPTTIPKWWMMVWKQRVVSGREVKVALCVIQMLLEIFSDNVKSEHFLTPWYAHLITDDKTNSVKMCFGKVMCSWNSSKNWSRWKHFHNHCKSFFNYLTFWRPMSPSYRNQ